MEEGQFVHFEPPEVAEERERAWRAFAQPGARIPVLWDDGVSTWEVAAVGEDGTIELRSAE